MCRDFLLLPLAEPDVGEQCVALRALGLLSPSFLFDLASTATVEGASPWLGESSICVVLYIYSPGSVLNYLRSYFAFRRPLLVLFFGKTCAP